MRLPEAGEGAGLVRGGVGGAWVGVGRENRTNPKAFRSEPRLHWGPRSCGRAPCAPLSMCILVTLILGGLPGGAGPSAEVERPLSRGVSEVDPGKV